MSDKEKEPIDDLESAVTTNTANVNQAINKINSLIKREKESGATSSGQITELQTAKSELEAQLNAYKQKLIKATNELNTSTTALDTKLREIVSDGRRRRSRKSRSKKKRSRRTKRKYRK